MKTDQKDSKAGKGSQPLKELNKGPKKRTDNPDKSKKDGKHRNAIKNDKNIEDLTEKETSGQPDKKQST